MTCIVGIAKAGRCYIGGDSAGVDTLSLSITTRTDQKVFTTGAFLMGFTTSFRMGQLLNYSFSVPAPRDGVPLMAYMSTDFIDAVRNCLKNGGFASKNSETESGGTFLVGFRGSLFAVYSDYQVEESIDGFNAVGCGAKFALGSLLETKEDEPETRIRKALTAAEHFSAGVRGPFNVVSA